MGLDHDYPYTHLSTFYELTATMGIEERDKEAALSEVVPIFISRESKIKMGTTLDTQPLCQVLQFHSSSPLIECG